MMSGNTWTADEEARLQKGKAFFAPLEDVLSKFVSECNVRAERFPKGSPQWDFRFRTPDNRTGYIAMWQIESGFQLSASHYDWMTPEPRSGRYFLPLTVYPNAESETVWRGLTEQLRAILAGEGIFKGDSTPRFTDGGNATANGGFWQAVTQRYDRSNVERRQRATLELPVARLS